MTRSWDVQALETSIEDPSCVDRLQTRQRMKLSSRVNLHEEGVKQHVIINP
jgi:hypothetical protein